MQLSELNLLDEMARPEMAELRRLMTPRAFADRSFISTPGDPNNQVFLIAEGRVRVYLACEDKEFTLAVLERGDIYSTHTGAFIQALGATLLHLAEAQAFRRVLAENRQAAKTTIRILGHMLRTSFTIIEDLAFHDIPARLIHFLLREARRQHGKTTGTAVVRLDGTVEELGRILGASRQTVSTQLSTLVRRDLLVRLGRGRYRIPDLQALAAAAEVSRENLTICLLSDRPD